MPPTVRTDPADGADELTVLVRRAEAGDTPSMARLRALLSAPGNPWAELATLDRQARAV